MRQPASRSCRLHCVGPRRSCAVAAFAATSCSVLISRCAGHVVVGGQVGLSADGCGRSAGEGVSLQNHPPMRGLDRGGAYLFPAYRAFGFICSCEIAKAQVIGTWILPLRTTQKLWASVGPHWAIVLQEKRGFGNPNACGHCSCQQGMNITGHDGGWKCISAPAYIARRFNVESIGPSAHGRLVEDIGAFQRMPNKALSRRNTNSP